MSQILINDYLKQLDLIKKVSGSQRETIVREAFKDLLKAWGRQHDLVFLAEYPFKTATKSSVAVDGALLHELRMLLGHWEATIRERFDTYRLANHKENVIDLLARVTTVSVETARIVAAMQAVGR